MNWDLNTRMLARAAMCVEHRIGLELQIIMELIMRHIMMCVCVCVCYLTSVVTRPKAACDAEPGSDYRTGRAILPICFLPNRLLDRRIPYRLRPSFCTVGLWPQVSARTGSQ